MTKSATLRIAKPRVALAEGDRMWDTDEIAGFLNVSTRTVQRMIATGEIPKPDKTIGRMKRWLPSTIEAWIQEG